MKPYLAILTLLLMAGMASAMTNNQTSYLAGVQDGWSLCYLRMTNLTAYNAEVAVYNMEVNSSLNESEAKLQWLAPAIPNSYKLPAVFR
jgi:hypothetical protein